MESNATKSKRRRRQIRDREKHNAARRLHYAQDSEYRWAKMEASRKQNRQLTTAKKGELAERACAKRARAKAAGRLRTSWEAILERPYVTSIFELENPWYVVEHAGQREHERWPMNDFAAAWIEHQAPAGSADLRKSA